MKSQKIVIFRNMFPLRAYLSLTRSLTIFYLPSSPYTCLELNDMVFDTYLISLLQMACFLPLSLKRVGGSLSPPPIFICKNNRNSNEMICCFVVIVLHILNHPMFYFNCRFYTLRSFWPFT